MKPVLASLLVVILFVSCRKEREVSRAFYYWKSVFKLSQQEQDELKRLQVGKLYVKYFDATWKEEGHVVIPEALIDFQTPFPAGVEIIPTVYITNKSLLKIPANDITKLSENIYKLIRSISKTHSVAYKELQFDCDWTDSTKTKYFRLLQDISQLAGKEIHLSATIRLHQVKYKEITGVPPVERGMLMFYNMGKLENYNTENSIFDAKEAAKYIEYIKKYPLPLDAALPVFTWAIHFSNNRVKNLLNNTQKVEMDTCRYFNKVSDNHYVANGDFFFRGDYFMKNDLVRTEEISPYICLQSAKLLSPEIKTNPLTVSLYHFDSSNLSRYETQDIENIYNCFR